jgi:hypothetical protein
VLQPLVESCPIEPHLSATGEERRDPGHAQLNGFLDREVHALAFGDPERQMDVEPGCRFRIAARLDQDARPIASQLDQTGRIVVSITIEQHQGRVAFEPQHLHGMACLGVRQCDLSAWNQLGIDMQTGQAHGARSGFMAPDCPDAPPPRPAAPRRG